MNNMKYLNAIIACAILAGCSTSVQGGIGNTGGGGQGSGQQPDAQPTVAVAGPTTVTNRAQSSKTVTDLVVSPSSFTLNTSTTRTVQATARYSDGTSDSDVTWSSSDDTIATVNPTNGQINGVKVGEATIVAQSRKNPAIQANVSVVVKQGTVVALLVTIEPKTATLKVGETVQLFAKAQTSDKGATNANAKWSSSNQSVAFVSETDGNVTAVGAGTATITAIAENDPSKKATATITVTQ